MSPGLIFIAVTVLSDIGGYVAGVLFGKHPMAPVISPKKSWEGFAGSAVACVVAGWLLVDYLLEGDQLSFPSAVTTPHPENNVVRARYFPERSERGRRRAVLVLPQWNADAGGHVGLCQLLNRFGLSALRLSLPYHDARMPPELRRADYIVSANVGLLNSRGEVLRRCDWLADPGIEIPEQATAVHGISTERARAEGRPAPLVVAEIWRTVSAIRETGIATLIVDRNARAVLAHTDRAVVLEKGRIVLAGESADIAADDGALDRYLGVQ